MLQNAVSFPYLVLIYHFIILNAFLILYCKFLAGRDLVFDFRAYGVKCYIHMLGALVFAVGKMIAFTI